MNAHSTKDLAYLQLLRELDRRLAQSDFLSFYMRMTGFSPPKHIRVMCKVAQALEDDIIDRAMIFAPPRHAKTLLFSELLPAWIMGRHPKTSLMSVMHTGRFAAKTGRKVRNLLTHQSWPFDLSLIHI